MKNSKWKKLSTRPLYKHPRLSLFEDDVILPNGHKTSYLHYGKICDAATIIAINDGKILIQREYSYPPNEWLYQFPGGEVNKNESAIIGAKRELNEEGNIDGDLKQIGWFYINNRRTSSKFYVFTAHNIIPIKTDNGDIEEEFEDHWLTINEIENLIANNDIRNYTALAAWAFFTQSTEYQKLKKK